MWAIGPPKDVSPSLRKTRKTSPGEPAGVGVAILRSVAAATLLLNRRTGHRPIGTKHAAIARLRFQQGFAPGALIEILTGIGGHDFIPRVPAVRAGQCRNQLKGCARGHGSTLADARARCRPMSRCQGSLNPSSTSRIDR